MHYLIYQITNKENGKIYVGKHMTDNIDDGYMGSGKYLKASQKLRGFEQFEKKILFECSSEDEMNRIEEEIVNEDFVAREDTYNIALGGSGGWKYVNSTGKNMSGKWNNIAVNLKNIVEQTGKNPAHEAIKLKRQNEEYFSAYRKKMSDTLKEYIKTHGAMWAGRKHSNETKKKMSDIAKKRTPDKSPTYGKKWVFNTVTGENKVVDKNFVVEGEWRNGRCFNVSDYLTREKLLSEIRIRKPKSKASIRMSVEHLTSILNNNGRRSSAKSGCKNKADKSIQKLTEYYTKIYNEYRENGYSGVKEKFGYTKSRANLVQQLKRYVKDYHPAENRNHASKRKTI